MKNARRRLYVNNRVQLDLIKRFLFHWFLFVVLSCLALTLWTSVLRADLTRPLSEHLSNLKLNSLILLVTFLSLCPFFLLDTLRLTNRFAGPMARLHRTIKAAARGQSVTPIHFRRGDYWDEIANEINNLIFYYEEALKKAKAQHGLDRRSRDDPSAAPREDQPV